MSVHTRAFALTIGILWGGCFLFTALANWAFPAYGLGLLQLAQSLYPPYHGPAGLGSVVIVTLCALVDGTLGGALMAWLYNTLARRMPTAG